MLFKFLAGAKNDARLHNILQSLILDLLFFQLGHLLSTLFGSKGVTVPTSITESFKLKHQDCISFNIYVYSSEYIEK